MQETLRYRRPFFKFHENRGTIRSIELDTTDVDVVRISRATIERRALKGGEKMEGTHHQREGVTFRSNASSWDREKRRVGSTSLWNISEFFLHKIDRVRRHCTRSVSRGVTPKHSREKDTSLGTSDTLVFAPRRAFDVYHGRETTTGHVLPA